MRLLVLYGVVDSFEGKLQKSFTVTIVLRKYQAGQMLSSEKPHLARKP